MNQQEISTKNNSRLTAYVHDAMELETKLYTMKELEKSLEGSKLVFKENMKKNLPKEPKYENIRAYVEPMSEISLQEQNKIVREKIKEANKKDEEENKKKNDNIGCFLFLLAYLISGTVVYFIFQYLIPINNDIVVSICVIIASIVLLGVFICMRENAKEKKIKNEETKRIEKLNSNARKHNAHLSEINAQIQVENQAREQRNNQRRVEYQLTYQEAKAQYDNQCAAYHAQLNQVKQSIQDLEAQRTRFYAIGIIPPDYREIDQIYQFDQIFRNDLADNMREAIKIYEERVFRGEVIRGIGNIVASINNLTGVMSGLARTIESVQTQVSFLSQDVYQMAQSQAAQQAESQAQLESIMSNAKATRFAAEAVRENSEKLVRYEEDRRKGYI